MTPTDALRFSLQTLIKTPLRTVLTVLMLGVGVAAVLTVQSLSAAGEAQVEREISRLGVNRVWITSALGSERALCADDGQVVASAVGSSACAGAYTLSAVSGGEAIHTAQVNGYDAGVEQVHDMEAVTGRLFQPGEYAQGAAVALVDEALDTALGGSTVGQRLDIGSRKVRVVGVVRGMTATLSGAAEGLLILPLRTFFDTYAADAEVSEITVSVPRGARAEDVKQAALSALEKRGGTYRAATLEKEIDAARSVVRLFVMVLLCVAAVCVLTGAIGVMNILLVSVRERRREIGLLKAVGATDAQVGALFLLEAAGYAALGGAAGLALGAVMVRVFGAWIGIGAVITPQNAAALLLCAAALGVAFGVLPAYRAAGMAPAEALKGE